MRDPYFLSSIISTLAVYLLIVAGLVIFVLMSGLVGVLMIFSVVVLLLVYFYDGFRLMDPRGKGRRS